METSPPVPDIKQSVLSRIEREGVCPRARWQFVGRECAVWAAWAATVLLAAVAVAVSFFIISHRQYALYEATHDNFWSFMFEVLPYMWIVVFIVSGVLALYHLRHTKRGYRYSLWRIALASIFLSFVGGMMLHLFGMSFMFDSELGEYVPGYVSQNKMEKQFWQQPSEGRLLGTYIKGSDNGATAIIEDMHGVRWVANTVELGERDLELLHAGTPVRLLGAVHSGGESGVFHACGVFPWMYDHMVTMKEMYDDREEALARLRQHKNQLVEKVRDVVPPINNTPNSTGEAVMAAKSTASAGENGARPIPAALTSTPSEDPQCPNIQAVQRLSE